jgi:peroxiredoxin
MTRCKSVLLLASCVVVATCAAADAAPKTFASAEETKPLKVGDDIPHAKVKTLEGKVVDLRDLATRGATVTVFYRGGWCPYCTTHLKELKDAMEGLKEMGHQVLAISPDVPEELLDAKDKNALPYILLSDSDMSAAAAFGIAFQLDPATVEQYKGYGIDLSASDWRLPVPSVFVSRADGVITFVHADPDYKERLSATAVLKAARESVAEPEMGSGE